MLQTELANELEVSAQSVNNWFAFRCLPNAECMYKVKSLIRKYRRELKLYNDLINSVNPPSKLNIVLEGDL
jgi:DNA-binding XRE family transcriptional regulator